MIISGGGFCGINYFMGGSIWDGNPTSGYFVTDKAPVPFSPMRRPKQPKFGLQLKLNHINLLHTRYDCTSRADIDIYDNCMPGLYSGDRMG